MKIIRAATVPFFLQHHLKGQIDAAIGAGHEVVLISSPEGDAGKLASWPGARFRPIGIARKISPGRDLLAAIHLYRVFKQEKPAIVHSATPKAGLLCALVGRLAGVPVRLHTFTGQVWAEAAGLMRCIGKLADRLIIRFNTRTYADSASQRTFLEQEGVAAPGTICVLGAGSLGGVDLSDFDPGRHRESGAAAASALGIAQDSQVILFVGRVNGDKGVVELVDAFTQLQRSRPQLRLILVGPFEPELDPLPVSTLERIRDDPCINAIGYDPEPARYMAFADILCLPSYREGFGNVVLEAAAMGVPAVGTDIPGLRDAVVNGETGILVAPRDSQALAVALESLLNDTPRRLELANAAQARARLLFDAKKVNALLLREYDDLVVTSR